MKTIKLSFKEFFNFKELAFLNWERFDWAREGSIMRLTVSQRFIEKFGYEDCLEFS